MVQPTLYKQSIEPNIKPGAALLFAHGFNGALQADRAACRYRRDPRRPPRVPAHLCAANTNAGRGVPCVYAVQQDKSGHAEEKAKAYAAGIGGARAMLIKTDFKEETETDLFGEQAVLCGGASELVLKGFETLVEAGYQPEIAYYEVLHELKLIVDLFYEGGITRMLEFVSETAQYGDYVSGPTHCRQTPPGTHEGCAERHPGRHLRTQLDRRVQRRLAQLQALEASGSRSPDRTRSARSCARGLPWLQTGAKAEQPQLKKVG